MGKYCGPSISLHVIGKFEFSSLPGKKKSPDKRRKNFQRQQSGKTIRTSILAKLKSPPGGGKNLTEMPFSSVCKNLIFT
jgi:hypothetical protein